MKADGLPHSEISGLSIACIYPKLIAACHVLHRLTVPRHPPHALIRLVNIICLPIFVYLGVRVVSPLTYSIFKDPEIVVMYSFESRSLISLPPLRLRRTVSVHTTLRLVGVPGVEPGTSSLSGMRSNQLSYTPF